MSFPSHFVTRFVLCLCAPSLLLMGQEEKRLTVYAPQGVHSTVVADRNGVEYVNLVEVARRLGDVVGKTDGKKFNLRFGNSTLEFRAGKNKVKVQGKNVDLGGPVEIDHDNLEVPVRGLAPLLGALLDQRVEYREPGRRLIIGAPIDFVAEIRGNPSRLMLHFSRPVTPKISNESGRLRMIFTAEPVVAPESTQSFNDKLIPSATYSETGGTAVLTVAGTSPLLASFSDEGKTVTISAAPQQIVEKPAAPAQTTPAPQPAQPPAQVQAPQPGTTAPAAKPRVAVVIDPAHGGDDRGAILEPGFNEKDLTLTLARKLRAALDRAGIQAVLLRDGDTTLTADQRAIASNTARTTIYVGVHAGSVGRGVRVYTARMSSASQTAGTMASWAYAQGAYLDRSRELADSVAAELARASIEHAEDSAQLQPLPHLTSAAVEIEVLPDRGGVSSLQSADYQQKVCAALAEGIAAGRRTLEASK